MHSCILNLSCTKQVSLIDLYCLLMFLHSCRLEMVLFWELCCTSELLSTKNRKMHYLKDIEQSVFKTPKISWAWGCFTPLFNPCHLFWFNIFYLQTALFMTILYLNSPIIVQFPYWLSFAFKLMICFSGFIPCFVKHQEVVCPLEFLLITFYCDWNLCLTQHLNHIQVLSVAC